MKYLLILLFASLYSCKKDCTDTAFCHTITWSYSACTQDSAGNYTFTNVRPDTSFKEVPICEADEYIARGNKAFDEYYELADGTWKQFLTAHPFKCDCN